MNIGFRSYCMLSNDNNNYNNNMKGILKPSLISLKKNNKMKKDKKYKRLKLGVNLMNHRQGFILLCSSTAPLFLLR